MSRSNIEPLQECLYHKIQTSEDVTKLRQCLKICGRSVLQSWADGNGYDALHHVIMADNAEAMGIIFAMGHFKAPHEPKYHSYIHLAANFGNRTNVAMLLQERPSDYSLKKTKFKWVKKPTEIPLMSKDGASRVSPLDVAANCGYVGCVKTILDVSSTHNLLEINSNNYLCTSTASNSSSALRLLLKQSPSEDDLKAAVGTALKLANADCLDVLLNCNPNLTSLFSGMNLYHVLFSYSMSFKREWYQSLLAVTSVLLKHGQNPMSTIPFRTYPLYSLLSHTPSSEFGQTSHYIIACMVLLLNADVDTNFNEVAYEGKHSNSNIQTAFGRSAFPSSLHCLYANVRCLLKLFEHDDVTHIHLRLFVTKTTETLLKHGADLSICGPIDNTEYHGDALLAFLFVVIKLGLDERTMNTFRLLTQNGSDPNLSCNGHYPVNVLVDEILTNSDMFGKKYEHSQASFTELVTEMVDTLLGNMTHTSLQEASRVEVSGKPTTHLQKKIFKLCRKELKSRSAKVQSLKAGCRFCLLKACHWKPTNVIELPLPLALKQYVNGVR